MNPDRKKSSADLPFAAGESRGSVEAMVDIMKPSISRLSSDVKSVRKSDTVLKTPSERPGLGSLYV